MAFLLDSESGAEPTPSPQCVCVRSVSSQGCVHGDLSSHRSAAFTSCSSQTSCSHMFILAPEMLIIIEKCRRKKGFSVHISSFWNKSDRYGGFCRYQTCVHTFSFPPNKRDILLVLIKVVFIHSSVSATVPVCSSDVQVCCFSLGHGNRWKQSRSDEYNQKQFRLGVN